MTAHLHGHLSRADCGLRAPRNVSRNVTPQRGGVVLHYGGPPVRIRNHDGCLGVWRSWQNFHMDGRGWSDIAYTKAACQHGYCLEGRGWGVRTAANGTDAGNRDYLAVVWLGGDGETPTQAALDAIEWCVDELRDLGAGMRVRPHHHFRSTSCPGPTLTALAARLDNVRVEYAPPEIPAPLLPVITEAPDMERLVRAPNRPRCVITRDNDLVDVRSNARAQAFLASGLKEYVVTDTDFDLLRDDALPFLRSIS